MTDQQIAVVGGDVWPGVGPDLLREHTVITQGRRIVEVGPRESTRVPEGARVIDATGTTVIPGLSDAHVHLTTNADENHVGPWSRFLDERTVQEMSLHGQRNGLRALASGFTTLRVMGIRDAGEPEIRDFTERGLMIGPRLLVTPWWISMTNGHGDLFYSKQHRRRKWDTADGPDACRALVRLLARRGADFIKVMASGGLLSSGDKASWPNFTQEELNAIVDEAHAMDLPVAAHATGLAGIRRSLAAGVDSIEHGIFLETDEIAQMAETGTFLVPTIAISDWMATPRGDLGIKPDQIAKISAVTQTHRDSLQEAIEAGVRIAAGTDSGDHACPFGEHARELELYVELGMAPYRALESATRVAAELFGRPGEIGALTPGAVADIVVVDGDPLSDIAMLRRPGAIRHVVKDGADLTGILGTEELTEPLRVPAMRLP